MAPKFRTVRCFLYGASLNIWLETEFCFVRNTAQKVTSNMFLSESVVLLYTELEPA